VVPRPSGRSPHESRTIRLEFYRSKAIESRRVHSYFRVIRDFRQRRKAAAFRLSSADFTQALPDNAGNGVGKALKVADGAGN